LSNKEGDINLPTRPPFDLFIFDFILRFSGGIGISAAFHGRTYHFALDFGPYATCGTDSGSIWR
jgi:hypothetical protein